MKKLFSLVLLAAPMFAATITYTTSTPSGYNGTPTNGNTTTTNWTTTLNLPYFDPSLGLLTKVTLILNGGVIGTVRLESEDTSPSAINYTLGAVITATGPGALATTVLPAASGTFNAGAYDGTTDFNGTSGVTLTGLTNIASQSNSSTVAAVLAQYTGLGNFGVNLTGNGNSSANGGGNTLSGFSTKAGASLTVQYDYSVAPASSVPEPSSMALLGLALVGAGVVGTRRKK